MKKIIKKISKIEKKSFYFIANSLILILIIIIGVVYLTNSILNKIAEVKAQEKVSLEYYPNLEMLTATNISSTSNKASKEKTADEKAIENLEKNLNTDDNINSSILIRDGLYAKVINSCDAAYGGTCVRARSCPSLSCPVVTSLRNDIVFHANKDSTFADGINWTHLDFSEWVRYPDRLSKDLYVATEYLEFINSYKANYKKDTQVKNLTNKKIIVDLSEQKLSAYNGDELFMEVSISTGLDDLPTPRGTFHIFEKTPSRYMQGPLPGISDQYYDLPGVPWTMYFTYQGAAIHGAYWHNNFGEQWSHGCVNLRPQDAELLYKWADMGTTVIVRN